MHEWYQESIIEKERKFTSYREYHGKFCGENSTDTVYKKIVGKKIYMDKE